MKNSLSKVLIISGVLLILVAVGLFVYSRIDDHLAGLRAQRLLEQVLSEGWDIVVLDEAEQRTASHDPSAIALVNDEEDQHSSGYAGRQIIGILEIPSLKLALPVLHASTNALLNISVARYTGDVSDRPERLVIAGHNFDSHFGRIYTLSPGDEILFTTPGGQTFSYSMIRLESCHMSEKEAVQAGDDWEITLLTCQDDRTMRYLVRFAATG